MRLAARPLWLTAIPAMRARGRSLFAKVESEESEEEVVIEKNGASAKTTTPSPRPYPSAEASRTLHLPSGDRAPRAQIAAEVAARRERLTPPARAKEEEGEEGEEISSTSSLPLPPIPSLREATPCAVATREEEHAVSTEEAGPPRPRACASLPTMKAGPEPATAAGASDGRREPLLSFPSLLVPVIEVKTSSHSWYMHPTKAPVEAATLAGRSEEAEDEDEDDERPPPRASATAASAASTSSRACGSTAAAASPLGDARPSTAASHSKAEDPGSQAAKRA